MHIDGGKLPKPSPMRSSIAATVDSRASAIGVNLVG
jgi:hypothetical protein